MHICFGGRMTVTVKTIPRKDAILQRKIFKAEQAANKFVAMRVEEEKPRECHLYPVEKIKAVMFKHAETCRALQHELALNVRGAVMRNPALMDIIGQNRTAVVRIDILMRTQKQKEAYATNSAPEDMDMKQPQIWADRATYENGNAYSKYTFHGKGVESQGKKAFLGRIEINLKSQKVTITYPKQAVGFSTIEMETSKIWPISEIGSACRDYCSAIERYVPQ